MGARSSKAIASTPAKPPPSPEASSCPSSWSDLPPELAGVVLGRLAFLADRVCFGSVCRHWRHAVQQQAPALPLVFPWIISFCGRTYQSIQDGQVRRLARSSDFTVCRGSSENWLLLSRSPWPPENRNFLENPLSGAMVPLPDKLHPDGDDAYGLPELSRVQKFIVCSSNLVVATTVSSWSTGRDPLVACCRPGMSSWSTSSHGAGGESYYEDIAFYHGDIYAITIRGDLFAHEVSVDDNGHGDGETTVSPAKQVIKGNNDDTCDSGISRFLVVSSRGNKLLMVSHEQCYGVLRGYVFKVFEADVEMSRWSQVTSLGDDQVLFLSRRCSKAVLAASSHDDDYLCGNRIYFIDHALHGPKKCRSRSGLASCGMYDFRDSTYHPIVSHVHRLGDVTAWFFPCK